MCTSNSLLFQPNGAACSSEDMKYLSTTFALNLIYWGIRFISHLHCCRENAAKKKENKKKDAIMLIAIWAREGQREDSEYFPPGTLWWCSALG